MIQKQYEKVFEGKLKVSIRQVPSTIKLRRWDPENPTSYEASIGGLLATVNDPRPHFRFYTSYYNPPRIKWDKPEYDALYDEAMRVARDICQSYPKAVWLYKKAILEGEKEEQDIIYVSHRARKWAAPLSGDPNRNELLAAQREHRKPVYKFGEDET